MRNLTDYSDQYILGLMENCNISPHKATANVQYAVKGSSIVPVLVIYIDVSTDWDYDYRCVFCEETKLLDFCDKMCLDVWSAKVMLDYSAFQENVNDIEYEQECFEKERQYEKWMAEELEWYNHARMMGWE